MIRQNNQINDNRILFEIKDGGSLTLKGLELDGMAGTATPAKYLICTDDDSMNNNYSLRVDSCYFHDVILGDEGNFFRAYPSTFADTIIFSNTLLYNCGKEGIRLKDEISGSGLYNVDHFEIYNCTLWKTRKEAIFIFAGF